MYIKITKNKKHLIYVEMSVSFYYKGNYSLYIKILFVLNIMIKVAYV